MTSIIFQTQCHLHNCERFCKKKRKGNCLASRLAIEKLIHSKVEEDGAEELLQLSGVGKLKCYLFYITLTVRHAKHIL